MRGYKVMYDYRGKVAGMIIAAVGLVALLVQKLTHFIVLRQFNSDQHFNMLLWFTLFGLFLMMFSFEKHEDERVKLVRSKCFMIVFGLMASATLAFAFTLTLMPENGPGKFEDIVFTAEDVIMTGRLMMFYPAAAMVIYLIIFHVGVYYDRFWDYNDNIGIWENLRKNKWHIIVLTVVLLIVIELIFRVFI